jgi:hypothetical protein
VITEGVVPLDPCLRITRSLWNVLLGELHRRTEGYHESGAFLLGRRDDNGRHALSMVYYDELDPAAYETGVCVLHADVFGRLWERCSALGLAVVADVHVHGRSAGQSTADRDNPMIARPGHLALILPLMARPPVRRWAIGVYEYLGDHQWRAHGGCRVSRVLKIEDKR